jgi:hypothetical protein
LGVKRTSQHWSKMWIRLLPMQVKVERTDKTEYESFHELNIVIDEKSGLTLEALERLKRLDVQATRPKELTHITSDD